MKVSIRKIGSASILLAVMTISIIPLPPTACTADVNVKDRALLFLSNVMNFDLTKYNVKLEASNVNYASTFGPLVKEENIVYTLSSSDSDIRANLVYENGLLWFCDLSFIKGKPIYASSPAVNVLDQAKGFMQKYQNYAAQNLAVDTSYLQPMRSMLNAVSELKTMTATAGNTKLEISTTISGVNNVPLNNIKWFYTENGAEVPRKSVALYFTNGTLRFFSDTWNLYTLGNPNIISQEEAVSIAMVAAEKYTLKFKGENDAIIEVKPDLSNVTVDASFAMAPRNSTILYPLWQIKLYFNKVYYNAYGIQVGVRGDTKEIAYCESLITLGGSGENPQTTPQPTETPTNVPPEQYSNLTETKPTAPPTETSPLPDNQSQQGGVSNSPSTTYFLTAVVAISVVSAATAIILKKRKR